MEGLETRIKHSRLKRKKQGNIHTWSWRKLWKLNAGIETVDQQEYLDAENEQHALIKSEAF